MPAFDVMRESRYVDGQWIYCIAWIRKPDGVIEVYSPGWANEMADEHRRNLEASHGNGLSNDDAWQYYAAQGGDGYFRMRTSSLKRNASSVTHLATSMLREMTNA